LETEILKTRTWSSSAAGVYDENFVLLHGGAQGVQATIKSFAEGMLSWTSILFQPWHMVYNKLEFKPIYFYLRNKQIVQNADIVLIFTNGIKDSEVYRVINYCNLVDKPYQVVDLLPDA